MSETAVRVTFPAAGAGAGTRDGEGADAASRMVVEHGSDGVIEIDGAPEEVRLLDGELPRVRLADADGVHVALVEPLPDRSHAAADVEHVEVVVDGWRFEMDVEQEVRARLRERAASARGGASHGGPLELRAIIPGRVVSVDVAIGDTVDPGTRLLVVEAMKMQNELRSPRGGIVGRLAVGAGQTVERGDLLLVLE